MPCKLFVFEERRRKQTAQPPDQYVLTAYRDFVEITDGRTLGALFCGNGPYVAWECETVRIVKDAAGNTRLLVILADTPHPVATPCGIGPLFEESGIALLLRGSSGVTSAAAFWRAVDPTSPGTFALPTIDMTVAGQPALLESAMLNLSGQTKRPTIMEVHDEHGRSRILIGLPVADT